MSIFRKAGGLDFDTWFRGLVGAAISGGSQAVTGAIVLPALDSTDFNVYRLKFYAAIMALFTAAALTSIFKFLSTEPLPAMRKIEITTQTTMPATSDSARVVETVKETKIEPIKTDQPKA